MVMQCIPISLSPREFKEILGGKLQLKEKSSSKSVTWHTKCTCKSELWRSRNWKTIARQTKVEGRNGKGRRSRHGKRARQGTIKPQNEAETVDSQILTVPPAVQGLVVLYQPKRTGSLPQPLLQAKQFLIKALFFFLECTWRQYKKLATDKSKEKKIESGRKWNLG